MNSLRWWSVLLLALALGAGAGWLVQWQMAAQLREEIVLLRDDQRDLARLRADHRRLVAAQVSEAELARLRADRAAVVRLRGEIENLQARAEQKERALARAALPLIAASEWKNAGRATPAATVETLLWAESRRDIDALAAMVAFDASLRPMVDRFFAVLPESRRAAAGSVEHLVAEFIAKDTPPSAMRIAEEKTVETDGATLVVQLKNQVGVVFEVPMTLQRRDDGWRLAVPPEAVQKIANAVGNEIGATR